MKKPNWGGVINSVRTTMTKHSPEILTGVGIAGMITTTVLAVKATPKALDLIRDQEDYLEVDKLTAIETVKTTWKCYIPAASTCVLSVACLVGASSTAHKRNAALAAAYKLSEKALSEYRDAVVETIGEKKELAVRDRVAEKQIEKDPVSKNEVIITEKGSTLCYDAISGRYFKSDMEAIKRAENKLNKQMLNEMYASLNDFYDYLDLDHTKIGNDLGWSVDDGLLDIRFSSHIADDGTPCIVIEHNIPPKYKYNRFT